MEAWHQRNNIDINFPFNLIITDMSEFPPHWHQEIEIVYVVDEALKIGLNNEIYLMNPRDIILIGAGDVHSFIPQPERSKRIILQFELSLFESFSSIMRDMKFISPLISPEISNNAHSSIEKQILEIYDEYNEKQEGFRIALKARMYDLLVVLLRQIPLEKYSLKDKSRHLNRLDRLEQVFKYVENNYDNDISLTEIANVANFSLFHFTRFFKDTTGMTFVQYLNNFRITKAIDFLTNSDYPITQIGFMSGFNNLKTFNRVFRQIKGCSPSEYRKNNFQ